MLIFYIDLNEVPRLSESTIPDLMVLTTTQEKAPSQQESQVKPRSRTRSKITPKKAQYSDNPWEMKQFLHTLRIVTQETNEEDLEKEEDLDKEETEESEEEEEEKLKKQKQKSQKKSESSTTRKPKRKRSDSDE